MKIIHTSDWHLGQNFFGYDRSKDHEAMIEQLVKLVQEEKPDALIIAGDIYDISVPGTAVQKDFAEYIVTLHNSHPEMTIVCISGNHDSASRHEVYQTPWEALNVKMVGKIDMVSPANNIIEVPQKGWIVAIPYTNERFLDENFYTKLEEATKEVTQEMMPIVYVGHAAITGCDFTGHNIMNNRFIGGIEYTSIDDLGSVYDYVALGHIHKAQTFGGGRARYSGSPIPVSFDEIRSGYEHGFTVVEIGKHGDAPVIRSVEVDCPHPLVNIPSDGYASWKDVMTELKAFPSDLECYIRLNVLLTDNELLPYDRDNQIRSALEDKKAHYAVINPTRQISVATEQNEEVITSMTMEELQEIDPLTVLASHAQSKGLEFSEEFKEMFDSVIRIINDADNEN